MSARNIVGAKGRPARKAETLPPSVSRLSGQCRSIQLTGIALLPHSLEEESKMQSCVHVSSAQWSPRGAEPDILISG
jgi:hypothetical protein